MTVSEASQEGWDCPPWWSPCGGGEERRDPRPVKACGVCERTAVLCCRREPGHHARPWCCALWPTLTPAVGLRNCGSALLATASGALGQASAPASPELLRAARLGSPVPALAHSAFACLKHSRCKTCEREPVTPGPFGIPNPSCTLCVRLQPQHVLTDRP